MWLNQILIKKREQNEIYAYRKYCQRSGNSSIDDTRIKRIGIVQGMKGNEGVWPFIDVQGIKGNEGYGHLSMYLKVCYSIGFKVTNHIFIFW